MIVLCKITIKIPHLILIFFLLNTCIYSQFIQLVNHLSFESPTLVSAPPDPMVVTYSFNNIHCLNENNGFISVYVKGGTAPFQYQLNGPISSTNATGIFTNLVPGTYTITLTDSSSPVQTQTISPIVFSDVSPLTTSISEATICLGESISIMASGGYGNYVWSPSEGLNTSTGNTVIAQPTTSTVYTVSSQQNLELITNGNFNNGNSGFGTDYIYLPNNPSGAQKVYTIGNNPNNWFSPFVNFTETPMLLVDASTQNNGNDRVWFQSVRVQPNTNYTFSVRARTIATPSPANLSIEINGTVIGSQVLPNTTAFWQTLTYSWNSGSQTQANISIKDLNTEQFGNDFALDDISFIENTNCTLTEDVTITVVEPTIPVFSFSNLSYCIGDDALELPTTSSNGIVGSWNPEIIDTSQSGTFTYIFTPNNDECATETEINVTISETQTPQFNFDNTLTYCLNDTPILLPLLSDNSIEGTWFPNQISTSSIGETTYIFTPSNASDCAEEFELTVTVTDEIISEFDISSFFSYCLGETEVIALPPISDNGIEGSWTPSSIDTNSAGTQTYVFTPSTVSCATQFEINVTIENPINPEFSFPTTLTYCQDETNVISLPTTSENGILGSWSPTTITTQNPGNFVYTFTPIVNTCAAPITVQVEITPTIIPEFPLFGPYCINQTVEMLPSTSINGINGTWTPAQIDTSETGNFTYTFTPNSSTNCSTPYSTDIEIVSPPTITDVLLQQNGFQLIPTDGNPPYEYSIDMGENWQSSNIFSNLPLGIYIVWVRSVGLDCYNEKEVLLFSQTNIITPNDDGMNDEWDASLLSQFEGVQVIIFDKYGKKIKELNSSEGWKWNGTFQGRALPSSTYWYIVTSETSNIVEGGWIVIKNR